MPSPKWPRQAVLALEILVSYLRARWWLGRTSLPRTMAVLRDRPLGRAQRRPGQAADMATSRVAAAVVRTLQALPADSSCLVRSIVISNLLARRGIASTLHLGVRSRPDFGAHAWVELGEGPAGHEDGHPYRRLTQL